jgi:hypothetical protein
MSQSLPGFVERSGSENSAAAQTNQTTETQQTQYDPNLVNRAKELGWRDQSEFRGPSDKWVPPDEFVRRGEEVLPIVRSQLEKERERVAELARRQQQTDESLRRQNEEWEQRLKRQEAEATARAEASARVAQLALQRQRDRFMTELDEAKRQIIPEDVRGHYDDLVKREQDFYRAVAQEEEQLRTINAEATRQATQAAPAPTKSTSGQRQLSEPEVATVNAWRGQNPWFDNKPEAARLANIMHVNLLESEPHLTLRENLERVSSEMRRRFPETVGAAQQQQTQQPQTQMQADQQREFYGYGNEHQQQTQQQNNGDYYSQANNSSASNGYGQQDQRQNQSTRTSAVEGGQSYNSGAVNAQKKGWMQIHPDDRRLFEATVFPTGVYGNDLGKARELWSQDYHSQYRD